MLVAEHWSDSNLPRYTEEKELGYRNRTRINEIVSNPILNHHWYIPYKDSHVDKNDP